MSTKTYRVVSAFAQGNTRHDKGVILQLTDKQATYLTMGGFIELLPETTSPAWDTDEDKSGLDGESSTRTKKGAKA